MKFVLEESKQTLSNKEKLYFLELFNGWASNPNVLLAEWDSSIEAFCAEQNVSIVFDESIPDECNPNEIYLSFGDVDKSSKSACFFRHFRNAFDHDHIYKLSDGDIIATDIDIKLTKKDETGKQEKIIATKMRCRCSFEFFKELTFLLLENGEANLNRICENNQTDLS